LNRRAAPCERRQEMWKRKREKMNRIAGGLGMSRYMAEVGFSDIAEELADKLREEFRKLSRKLNDHDLNTMVSLYPDLIHVLSDRDRRRVHEIELEREPEAKIELGWTDEEVEVIAPLVGLEYEQLKELVTKPMTEEEKKLQRISMGSGLVHVLADRGFKDIATKLLNKLQGELREIAPDLSDGELASLIALEPKLFRGLSKSDQMRVFKRKD
jgi:predicted house-cleaning noncanonical NTP pyrophosphatase (MazG superfamily)